MHTPTQYAAILTDPSWLRAGGSCSSDTTNNSYGNSTSDLSLSSMDSVEFFYVVESTDSLDMVD